MSRPAQSVQLEDIPSEQAHNNRYSFMENPVDEAPSSQNQVPMSPSSVPINANVVPQQHLQHHPQHIQHVHQLQQQHSQQHLQHLQQHPQQYQYQYQYQTVIEPSGPPQHQPAQLIPNEKERHLQEEGMIPTYSKYPPPDQHPAHFAPYAEPVQQYAVQHAEPVQQYAIQHAEPVQQFAIQHVQSPIQSPMQSPLHSPLHSPLQSPLQSPIYSPIHSPMYAQQHVLHHPQQYQQPQLQQQPQQQTYAEPPSSPGPLPVKTNPDPPIRSDTVTIAPDANPLQSPKIPSFPARTQGDSSRRPVSEDLSAFHQPGQVMHPAQEVRGGGWSYGMCDCSNNIWACFLGLTLPCILYGKTQYRLNRKSKKEDPTNMLGYETCNGACTGMAILCGCQCILATIQRSRTRKAYGIDGDIASDCARGTCCCCCTLIQNEKEIQKREEKRGRVALERGATLTSPYMAPAPMTFPPPPK